MARLIYPLLALLALGACNTVQGAGQDLSTAGETISDEAEQTQNDL